MENLDLLGEQEFQKHANKIINFYPSFILMASEREQEVLYSTMIRLLETNSQVPAKTLILFYIHFFSSSVNDQAIDLIRKQSIVVKDEIEETLSNLKRWEKGWGKKRTKIPLEEIMGTVTILTAVVIIWPQQCKGLLQECTKTVIFIYQSMLAEESDSKETKLCILSFLQVLLKNLWWDYLPSTTRDEAEKCLNDFCDWGLVIMEDTSVDGKVNMLENAPLLLDFELRYHLMSDLQQICVNLRSKFELDFTRLETFMSNLQNVVIFSGNASSMQVSETSKVGEVTEMASKYAEMDTDLLLKASAIHDLFPDLGMGFIEICLKEMSNDSETVIMKILDNSLPSHLAALDRKMESIHLSDTTNMASKVSPNGSIETLASFQSFGIDEKANTAQRSKLHNDSEELERAEFIREHKNLILNSASRFEDDDEYDDTYDNVADTAKEDRVEGTVPAIQKEESYLIKHYLSDPSVFHPSKRKSMIREEMKSHLDQTDEQIEGWYLMLNRNPTKDKILEKYEWRGNRSEGLELSTSRVGYNQPRNVKGAFRGGSKSRGIKRSKRGQRTFNPHV